MDSKVLFWEARMPRTMAYDHCKHSCGQHLAEGVHGHVPNPSDADEGQTDHGYKRRASSRSEISQAGSKDHHGGPREPQEQRFDGR